MNEMEEPWDGPDDSFLPAIEDGVFFTLAVLPLVNDPAITADRLVAEARFRRQAAENILRHRLGADGLPGTADDDAISTLTELDGIKYIGPIALARLEAFARSANYLGPRDTDPDVLAVRYLLNDPDLTLAQLDLDAGLDRHAAENLLGHRLGADGLPGTGDDESFDDLEEIDAIKFVGPVALERLLAYALSAGYRRDADVIFSPQLYMDSHNARVARVIDSAKHTLDIAMYSYSDAGIADALGRAVSRGVKVRFLFEAASEDRKLDGAARARSASGKLEQIGVDVRYVNKIMHHKMMIVDGPRDDAARARHATVVTGSGNWSRSAATFYDENTLFLKGYPEITLRMQREFNLLWEHSRDFALDTPLPFERSTYEITDDVIRDEAESHVHFTSRNFSVSGDTFSNLPDANEVADVLVRAIMGAKKSIWIASGHLRSRPIAEALIRRHRAAPGLDIKVYLDGQEYISEDYHEEQVRALEVCLAEAGMSGPRRRECLDRGFLFGYQVGLAGIPVRYKAYAYRWHYSYAEQMHHKYMIVDGEALYSGSYNYSDNAEHNAFENLLVWRGALSAPLVKAFEENFKKIWDTRTAELHALIAKVKTAPEVPLVFPGMALTWEQLTQLRELIRASCSAINSEDYRLYPEKHKTCPRL